MKDVKISGISESWFHNNALNNAKPPTNSENITIRINKKLNKIKIMSYGQEIVPIINFAGSLSFKKMHRTQIELKQ